MHNKIIGRLRWLLNKRWLFWCLLIFFGIAIPLGVYYNNNKHLEIINYKFITEISLGYWAEICAGLTLTWVAYLYQRKLRQLFGFSDIITIRAPLMLATAPLFVSKKLGIWEQHNLELDLDFRYAGVSALDDLFSDHCDLAVASDVAAAAFISNPTNNQFFISVLPFVKIENHLRFIVNKSKKIKLLNDLTGKKIAYLKDSVHTDFLKAVETEINSKLILEERENVMECYNSIYMDEVDACILWEPHYSALQKNSKMELLDHSSSAINYTWFLCLIAKQDYINLNPVIAKNIFDAMRKAVHRCAGNPQDIIDSCLTYLHPEFTGLKHAELKKLIDLNKHQFGIDANIKAAYLKKLTSLKSFGGGRLTDPHSIWPGY